MLTKGLSNLLRFLSYKSIVSRQSIFSAIGHTSVNYLIFSIYFRARNTYVQLDLGLNVPEQYELLHCLEVGLHVEHSVFTLLAVINYLNYLNCFEVQLLHLIQSLNL